MRIAFLCILIRLHHCDIEQSSGFVKKSFSLGCKTAEATVQAENK